MTNTDIDWSDVPNAERDVIQIKMLNSFNGFYTPFALDIDPSIAEINAAAFLKDPEVYLADPKNEGKRPSFAGFDFAHPWAKKAKALLEEAVKKNSGLLRGADLRRIRLDIDLSEANLERADLIGADLRNTDLIGAVLRGALMEEALLTSEQRTYALQQGAILDEWVAVHIQGIEPK